MKSRRPRRATRHNKRYTSSSAGSTYESSLIFLRKQEAGKRGQAKRISSLRLLSMKCLDT
jgi:hypothetical protein